MDHRWSMRTQKIACEIAEKNRMQQTHRCHLAQPTSSFCPGKKQRRLQTHWSLLDTRGSSEWVKVPFFVEGIVTSWLQETKKRDVGKSLPMSEGARARFLRSPESILKMETQPSVANAAWPSLTQHGESKEQPSCLDTRHQDHTQWLHSLVLLAVDDWGSFPAWDFICEACPVYGNCWDFWRGWLGYGPGNEHKELLLETKMRHVKIIKWMSKLGPLLGLHSADKLTLDVSHLLASQLLTHSTSSPICRESHSPLLECSHLWSSTQQLFKELTETNQGQDMKAEPKCRGKQGREKCQPSP